ncbi:TonB-dependent receptor domain-containing protein [Azospirillum agricola]|uniref:TonB-dependent receptor domain-containing protein n=1 Tax=Azospirillum agricola TaxID=1720247 RepID=UPI000A0F1F39|nr:TonB-dependent receptor [Azospirillum agricola]SMH47203.1 outer membrane receptor for ferrienterochelin and colicins [Azospirillum lipoferum]
MIDCTAGACAKEEARAETAGAGLGKILIAAAVAGPLAGLSPAALAQSDASQATQTLGPVTVTASGTEQSTLTAPAFTTVITSEDIEHKGPSNGLPDILRQTVGINDNADNLGRDEVVIRGLGANYTLVLVDGKRISSSDALWRGSDFDYHAVPLSAIERVEVVRGPMSALYGSDAMGGVVNIITKKPSDKWTGSVGAEYRLVDPGKDGNQYRLNLYGAGPITEKLSASIAGELYNRQPWYHGSKNNGTVPIYEKKNLKDMRTALRWEATESQILDFSYAYNHDERPYNIYDAVPSYSDQDVKRNTFALSHTGKWGWGTTMLEANYENADIDDYNSSYNAPRQRSLSEKNLFLHGRTNFALGFNNLTAGAEYRKQTIEDPATYVTSGKSEITQKAAYLQDAVNLTDALIVTVGGRYDHHEIFGGQFTGRTNLVYRVTDKMSLKAGVSQGYKAPDAYQLNPEYRVISCGGRCFLSGNPNLKPEESTNYEVGFEIREKTWDVNAVVFKNKVKDMIDPTYDPVLVQRNYTNINKVDLSGLEIAGSFDIISGLTFNGNYAYLHAKNKITGGTLENRPAHKAHGTLTWQALDDLSVAASAHYTGPQFEGGTNVTNKVPGYTTFDLGVTGDVNDAIRLQAGVKNITNVILTEKTPRFQTHELGRNYYVSANYRF